MRRISFKIPEVPPSYNMFYAGIHWSKRKQMANEWHNLVAYSFLEKYKGFKPIKSRNIKVDFVINKKGKLVDIDNFAVKLIIDGLKGILYEDDDQIIEYKVTRGKKKKNETEVLFHTC